MWEMHPKITQEHEEYQGYPEQEHEFTQTACSLRGIEYLGRGLREGGMCG
jgi:hypothetical protein